MIFRKKTVAMLLVPLLVISLLLPAGAFAGADVQGHWSQAAMERWQHNGIVSGYPDGSLKPDKGVTRAELVTMLNGLFGFAAQSDEPFADVPASAWYASQLSAAREAGYYNGFPGNLAKPGEMIARQDMLVLLNQIFKLDEGDNDASAFADADRIADYAKSAVQAFSSILSGYSDNTFRPNGKVTRAEFVTVINRLVAAYYSQPGEYNDAVVDGHAIVGHSGVKLGTTVIKGNLYIGAAVQGELRLGEATVSGVLHILGSGAIWNGQKLEPGEYQLDKGKIKPKDPKATPTPTNSPPSATPSPTVSPAPTETPSEGRTERLVDPDASQLTKSLFAYLRDAGGEQVLFGHQHATTVGVSFQPGAAEPQSDVYNAVGDYPAVFGWDTLSLDGFEPPGVYGDYEQNISRLAAKMEEAHELGGIVTLSAHMPNFVTGGDFRDTRGSAVESILPGGSKHEQFNAYLDRIAALAHSVKDEDGNAIPIMFRPFHEQNGSWFWWGAQWTLSSQYIELFRYTVEYLRDTKDVHNMLYVFAPNGSFSGNESGYLRTYPGDAYVDILAMDQYDNNSAAGSQSFRDGLVDDLAMLVRMADDRGKIAALSEFGYSPEGMSAGGNGDVEWFTKLLNAIKADDDAKRIAYMLTWANFGANGNLFVPYRNAPGLGDHELLDNFVQFYEDDYSGFAAEVAGVYGYDIETVPQEPFLHIVSPVEQGSVKTAETVIRSRVLYETPTKVVYVAEGSSEEVEMSLDEAGFYSASWSPPGYLNTDAASITVKAYKQDEVILEQTVTARIQISEIELLSYTFDHNIDGIQNNGTYPDTIGLALQHGSFMGDGVLQLDVTNADESEGWQELKLELQDIKDKVQLDKVRRISFEAWIPLEAGAGNPNAGLRGIAMLPPDWSDEGKYGMTSTVKRLTELDTVQAGDVQYVHYPVTIDLDRPDRLAEATGLALSLVGSGLSYSGPVYVDNIKLYSVYQTDPVSLVDNFEGYQGSDAALRDKFIHAGGGAAVVELDGAIKNTGRYGMKLSYTLGAEGYAGVKKELGEADWSAYNRLKLWLKPDGWDQRLVVQLKVDGGYYEAYPSLAGTEAEGLSIHFNEFVPAPWDAASAGKRLNKVSLQKVQHFAVYINSVDGAAGTSELYFDDIEAVNDGTGGVPSTPGSPGAEGMLYDFENGMEGWGLNEGFNSANGRGLALTNETAAGGEQSLKAQFDLNGGSVQMVKMGSADFSGMVEVKAKVKVALDEGADAGSGLHTMLFIQTGGGWEWASSTYSSIEPGDFMTLTFDISHVNQLNAVQAFGIQIDTSGDGLGSAVMYIDDVEIIAGDGPPVDTGVHYGFESAEDGWRINTDNSNAYNTANASGLGLTGDEAAEGVKSIKTDFSLNGGNFQLYKPGSANFSGYSLITAKVKAMPAEGADAGTGVRAQLFIQTGGGWAWANSADFAVGADDFTTLSFDISGIADLGQVQAFGVQVLAPSGSGTAVVYVDDVTVQ